MFWSLPSTRATALLPRTSAFLDVMSAVMFRRSFAGMPFLTSHAVAATIAIGVAASSERSESTTDTCGCSAEPLEHAGSPHTDPLMHADFFNPSHPRHPLTLT